MALLGLVGMTATYEGDQFENVTRLYDCGAVPLIAKKVDVEEASLDVASLELVNNLAFSGNTAVIQVSCMSLGIHLSFCYI